MVVAMKGDGPLRRLFFKPLAHILSSTADYLYTFVWHVTFRETKTASGVLVAEQDEFSHSSLETISEHIFVWIFWSFQSKLNKAMS